MNFKNIKPLNKKELKSIGGGESGWYWVIYKIGSDIFHAKKYTSASTSVYTDGSYVYY